jgi:hypothetical protein
LVSPRPPTYDLTVEPRLSTSFNFSNVSSYDYAKLAPPLRTDGAELARVACCFWSKRIRVTAPAF